MHNKYLSRIQPRRQRRPLILLAGTLLATWLLAPTAFAVTVMLDQNGTNALFWDGVSAVNCDVTATTTWTTDKTGVAAPTVGAVANNFQFGTNQSDFNGAAITFNTLAATLTGTSFVVVSTNCTVTWASTGNAHFNTANVIVSVATNSTLIWTSTANNNGFNFNNRATTFAGGGTMNFQDAFCANAQGAAMVMNMPGGTNQLNQTKTSNWGATVGANFTLTNGTLQFGSASALADTFQAFVAGDTFNLNGGIIDNLSGAPGKLALGGGGYAIGGSFTFAGSSSLDLGTGAVTNKGNNTITVNASTLAIGGVINGNTSGNSLTKAGNGTLQLSGVSTYSGNTIVNAGTLALTNSASIASSAQVAVSNATFDVSGLASGLTSLTAYAPSNSTLTVAAVSGAVTNVMSGTVNVGGTTNRVNVTFIPLVTSYPATFHIVKGATVNGTLNFGLGTVPSATPAFAGYITNRAASGLVDLVLTSGPAPVRQLVWAGTDTGNNGPTAWDQLTSLNWTNAGIADYTTYNQLDAVQFDDTSAGSPSPGLVNLEGTLTPGGLVISNNVLPYTFTGGSLGDGSGSLTMTKNGPGVLFLEESGDNFSGAINVLGGTVVVDNDSSGITGGANIGAGGTLQVGTNDTAGTLPSGTVNANGTLVFNRFDNINVDRTITGSGTVSLISSNVLTLSGTSSGNWSTLIQNGTLQPLNNASLGSLPGGAVTVTNGGTLDIGADTTQNAVNFGAKHFIISGSGAGGNGAIINSSSVQQINSFQSITLAADATIGGPSRWDIRGGAALLDLAGHTLTKTNANQDSFVSAHVTSGNIIIQQGIASFESTSTFDASAGTITVNPGGYLGQFRNVAGSFTRSIVLNGGGTTNFGGVTAPAFVDATILLTADSTLGNPSGTEYFNGVISDGGSGFGLMNVGNGTNFLGATNTYTGGTIIAQGILGLTNHGSIATSPFIIVTNGATFDVSALVVPYAPTNFLVLGDDTQGSGTLNLGTTLVTNANYISLSNAIVQMAVINAGVPCITVTNLDLGDGTASTINITGLPIVTPTQIPLIKYVNLTGTYSLNVTLPSGYNGNLVNNLANNSIDLAITTFPGGIWNGGSATGNNWSDAANWSGTGLSGSDSLVFTGNSRLNNINDLSFNEIATAITFLPGVGAFTLNGNPVTLNGGVTNSSSNLQTINLGLSFGGNGTNISFDGGSAGLILGGGLTNTFGTPAYTIMTLAGTGRLTNILNSSTSPGGTNIVLLSGATANWTLLDNASSTAMTVPWDFQINNGTLNFGFGSSAPTLTNNSAQGLPQDNQVGAVSGATGALNISNGTWTTTARLNTALANSSTGIVNQAGGTFNIGNQFQGANGGTSNALSIVNVSGGSMNIGGGGGQFYVASRDQGILTVSGAAALNCGNLDLSRDANGNARGTMGVVNLNGGVITCSRVGTATANSQSGPPSSGVNPTASFNFNGGTLKARTNAANFFQGNLAGPAIPITTTVKSGGAIIDDGGFAISVLEPLQHDAALGVTPDGGFLKLGAGINILTAASTYTGNTVVSNGTLVVNGSLAAASAVTVTANATLSGIGVIGGSVTVNGTIDPGNPGTNGLLTVAGGVAIAGTNNMQLDKGNLTNDVLVVGGNLAYGGTLNVSVLSGGLAANDSFKLFTAASSSGNFAVTNLPALTGGLLWNWNPASGTLSVVSGVNPTPTNMTVSVVGNVLTLSWPADHTGWTLQAQTNSLGAGLNPDPAAWANIPGSTAVNSVNIPLDPAAPTVFYRMKL